MNGTDKVIIMCNTPILTTKRTATRKQAKCNIKYTENPQEGDKNGTFDKYENT